MTYAKFAYLVIATIAASAPGAFAQQAPETSASTPPAPAATTNSSSNEADEVAALIAKANAAAAANANAVAASTTHNKSLTEIEASQEERKKAKEFGFQAEVYNGSTLFCKEDAALGTRIKSKRCMSAYEFDDYAVQLKIARDLLKQKNQCQGGDLCGGLQ